MIFRCFLNSLFMLFFFFCWNNVIFCCVCCFCDFFYSVVLVEMLVISFCGGWFRVCRWVGIGWEC